MKSLFNSLIYLLGFFSSSLVYSQSSTDEDYNEPAFKIGVFSDKSVYVEPLNEQARVIPASGALIDSANEKEGLWIFSEIKNGFYCRIKTPDIQWFTLLLPNGDEVVVNADRLHKKMAMVYYPSSANSAYRRTSTDQEGAHCIHPEEVKWVAREKAFYLEPCQPDPEAQLLTLFLNDKKDDDDASERVDEGFSAASNDDDSGDDAKKSYGFVVADLALPLFNRMDILTELEKGLARDYLSPFYRKETKYGYLFNMVGQMSCNDVIEVYLSNSQIDYQDLQGEDRILASQVLQAVPDYTQLSLLHNFIVSRSGELNENDFLTEYAREGDEGKKISVVKLLSKWKEENDDYIAAINSWAKQQARSQVKYQQRAGEEVLKAMQKYNKYREYAPTTSTTPEDLDTEEDEYAQYRTLNLYEGSPALQVAIEVSRECNRKSKRCRPHEETGVWESFAEHVGIRPDRITAIKDKLGELWKLSGSEKRASGMEQVVREYLKMPGANAAQIIQGLELLETKKELDSESETLAVKLKRKLNELKKQ